jgi:segregation and condensation protein B
MEAIRGVSCDYAVQKLLEKDLIVISGRNEKLPGHPLVYSTSKTFMDYFGINTAEDLPKIKEVLPEQLVEPTIIKHTESELLTENKPEDTDDTTILSVSEEGELVENSDNDEATN